MSDAGELGELLYFLELYRDIMVYKIEGLSEEQARVKPTPNGNSLLNLIVHLTGVESWWFQEGIAGGTINRTREDEFAETTVTVEEAVAAYRAACARSNDVARGAPSLGDKCKDETIAHFSVRAVMLHVLEETARHAGHADITRELVDGTTGFSRHERE